jgi:enamine deaminase RidA (YjgF/YER057c/UK114 family)
MLGNLQTWLGRDSVPWGDTPADRTPVLSQDGLQAGILNQGSMLEQETAKVVFTKAGPGQAFLVASPRWGADAAPAARAAYDKIARLLQAQGLAIAHERLFGSLGVKPAVMVARNAALSAASISPEGPVTYIQGQPPWGEGLAGVIIRAVSCRQPQDEVWTIQDQGKPVGRGWRQGDATFLILQNLQGLALNGSGANDPPQQARRMIHCAAQLLEAQGASYRDVARTWFYLKDILAWYPEFNQARSAVYRELGLMPINGGGAQRLPASTGIQGAVSTAVALDLLAVMGPPEPRSLVRQLRSLAQPEALTYGSAFSRGALIHEPDVNLIQVSGTAAIDEQGQSLYAGDVRAQIDCTFDKIAALIGQEGANLQDIAAASVFVKRPEDALVYQDRAAARGLENLPAVIMVADVCREELLFEIDAEVAFNPAFRGL